LCYNKITGGTNQRRPANYFKKGDDLMKRARENLTDYCTLRAEILKQLALRKWRYADLAKATGYSYSYVNSFLNGINGSYKIAKKIVDVLDLPEHLAG